MVDMNINITVHNDIVDYCKNKNITDIEGYINNLVFKAYMIDKYGMLKKTEDNKLVNVPLSDVTPTDAEPIKNKKENYEDLYD